MSWTLPKQAPSLSMPASCHNGPVPVLAHINRRASLAAWHKVVASQGTWPPCASHGRSRSAQLCHAAIQADFVADQDFSAGVPWVSCVLPHPAVDIHLFGVVHGYPQADIAEFILNERPWGVLVETAMTNRFGAKTGNVFDAELDFMAGDNLARWCIHAARHLSSLLDPTASDLWQDAKENLDAEQLAYVAAMVVGSRIIYADRPPAETYRQLFARLSVEDLERAFAFQVAANNHEVMTGAPLPPDCECPVSRILIFERDAVLAASIADAATLAASSVLHADPLAPSTPPREPNRESDASSGHAADNNAMEEVVVRSGARRPMVVAVMGEAHVPGIESLWRHQGASSPCLSDLIPVSGEGMEGFRDCTGQAHGEPTQSDRAEREPFSHPVRAESTAKSESGDHFHQGVVVTDIAEEGHGASRLDPGSVETSGEVGLRRGLLHAVLGLTCLPGVIEDMEEVLGPVPDSEVEAYGWTLELYSYTRMLLAVLPQEELAKVCSGWRCDMFEVLGPVRGMLRVHGGPGYEPNVALHLRDTAHVYI